MHRRLLCFLIHESDGAVAIILYKLPPTLEEIWTISVHVSLI